MQCYVGHRVQSMGKKEASYSLEIIIVDVDSCFQSNAVLGWTDNKKCKYILELLIFSLHFFVLVCHRELQQK